MDWQAVIGIAVGTILPFILATFVPNTWFKNLGVKAGRDLSRAGRKLVGKDAFEKIENNFTGSLLSFAQGVVQGADEDDNSADSNAGAV